MVKTKKVVWNESESSSVAAYFSSRTWGCICFERP